MADDTANAMVEAEQAANAMVEAEQVDTANRTIDEKDAKIQRLMEQIKSLKGQRFVVEQPRSRVDSTSVTPAPPTRGDESISVEETSSESLSSPLDESKVDEFSDDEDNPANMSCGKRIAYLEQMERKGQLGVQDEAVVDTTKAPGAGGVAVEMNSSRRTSMTTKTSVSSVTPARASTRSSVKQRTSQVSTPFAAASMDVSKYGDVSSSEDEESDGKATCVTACEEWERDLKPSSTKPSRGKKQTSLARAKPSGEESEKKRKRTPFSSVENVAKSDPTNRRRTKRQQSSFRQASSTESAADDTASSKVLISNGPFQHLWNDADINSVQVFFQKLMHLQGSLSDPDYCHHLKGLFPFISEEQLQKKETFRAILSCIHPKTVAMIMGDGFDAGAIPRKVLADIEKATLEDGVVVPEYQVDMSELTAVTREGKVLHHQDDANKFGPIHPGAYIKAYVGRFGEFKELASSYLKKAERRGDKLATFLTIALNRHKELKTSEDAVISLLYIGTTCRAIEVRLAEHDSNSSNSLNALFFREFHKACEFPAVFSVAGNIEMSLTVEAFLAGIIQLSTLRTLRSTNPNANFFLQGCDGSALTLANAGQNLRFANEDIVTYLKTFRGDRDGLLSGIELPEYVESFMEYNIEAILDFHASKFDDSFPKQLADMKKKLTLRNLNSFVSSIGHDGAVDSIANQMGISTAEASSEFGRRGHTGAVDSIASQMGISTAEASSELGRRGCDGLIDSLNARNNRVSDTTLQCFKCYKNDGVQTLRKLPVKSTHRGGLLEGHVQVDHHVSLARCGVCKKNHSAWVEPDKVDTILERCCISENCFNVCGASRPEAGIRYYHSEFRNSNLCERHHKEQNNQS
ncbi:hypothetical protein ACHAWT_000189 [Skeletonema menzelii]